MWYTVATVHGLDVVPENIREKVATYVDLKNVYMHTPFANIISDNIFTTGEVLTTQKITECTPEEILVENFTHITTLIDKGISDKKMLAIAAREMEAFIKDKSIVVVVFLLKHVMDMKKAEVYYRFGILHIMAFDRQKIIMRPNSVFDEEVEIVLF
jgi:phenolic acid decarboxylase